MTLTVVLDDNETMFNLLGIPKTIIVHINYIRIGLLLHDIYATIPIFIVAMLDLC